MPATEVMPELKEIVGAMIFAANRPIGVGEMHRCLQEVARTHGGETAVFAETRPSDVRAALGELEAELLRGRCGFVLKEVAGGFRLQSRSSCGRWLRHLLDRDKPRRLSVPALETLAIIAYRQPVSRAEIENVRGVAVDHVVKLLMELHLIRIVGRSELPGRPFLYGTTRNFLEHFGLKDLKDLEHLGPGILRSLERERLRAEQSAQAGDDDGGQTDCSSRSASGSPTDRLAEPMPQGTDRHAEPMPQGTDRRAEPMPQGTDRHAEPMPQGTDRHAEPMPQGIDDDEEEDEEA